MRLAGAYPADRAAALSGVPKSTVYYWARNGHLVPSVSESNVKLWSYKDLLALRTIYWLRRPKSKFEREIAATSMKKVQRALAAIKSLNLELFENGQSVIAVAYDGEILLNHPAGPLQLLDGQLVDRDLVDILAPFPVLEGSTGPHLQQPRPLLRIMPRKIGGAPHVLDTRVTTEAIFALHDRGLTDDLVARIFPFLSREQIAQGVDLEEQLQSNLRIQRAA